MTRPQPLGVFGLRRWPISSFLRGGHRTRPHRVLVSGRMPGGVARADGRAPVCVRRRSRRRAGRSRRRRSGHAIQPLCWTPTPRTRCRCAPVSATSGCSSTSCSSSSDAATPCPSRGARRRSGRRGARGGGIGGHRRGAPCLCGRSARHRRRVRDDGEPGAAGRCAARCRCGPVSGHRRADGVARVQRALALLEEADGRWRSCGPNSTSPRQASCTSRPRSDPEVMPAAIPHYHSALQLIRRDDALCCGRLFMPTSPPPT